MIPETLIICDQLWTIKQVPTIDKGRAVGECNPNTLTITIDQTLPTFEKLTTLVHEVLHVLEFSKNIKIGHPLINKIESPLASLIVQLLNAV